MTVNLHKISTTPRDCRPLVEAGLMLRVRDLRGVHGFYGSHELTASDDTTINLHLDVGKMYGWVHIEHRRADHAWSDPGYQVALISTPQPFGGRRWRFVCPERGRPCGVLYLPIGGNRFASRQAHGLAFASQRLRGPARAAVRAQRIRLDLGGSADLAAPFPPKPRGMHAATYERLQAVLHPFERRHAFCGPGVLTTTPARQVRWFAALLHRRGIHSDC